MLSNGLFGEKIKSLSVTNKAVHDSDDFEDSSVFPIYVVTCSQAGRDTKDISTGTQTYRRDSTYWNDNLDLNVLFEDYTQEKDGNIVVAPPGENRREPELVTRSNLIKLLGDDESLDPL